MKNYKLKIDFPSTDELKKLRKEGYAIGIVHTVDTIDPPALFLVVWECLKPLKENTVTWNDAFRLYASETLLVVGDTIQPVAATKQVVGFTDPDGKGMTYMYTPPEWSTAVQIPLPKLTVQAFNGSPNLLTMGLSLGRDSESSVVFPICATSVDKASPATFTNEITTSVFLAKNCKSGQLLDKIPEEHCEVRFLEGTYEHDLTYSGGEWHGCSK